MESKSSTQNWVKGKGGIIFGTRQIMKSKKGYIKGKIIYLEVLFVNFFKAPRSQRRLISSSNLTVSFLTAFFLGLFSFLSSSGILMEFSPSFNFSSISVSNRCTSTSTLELIFLSDLTSISLIKVLNFSRSFFSGCQD